MWRLLVPFDYLFRVQHPEKWKFDYLFPILSSMLAITFVYLLDIKVVAYGDNGLVSNLQSITSILTGFFIAALAAVATFPSTDMDRKMPGKNPMKLVRHRKGHDQSEELTRRRFLCLMFGYSAALSFLLFLLGAVGKIVGAEILLFAPESLRGVLHSTLLGMYLFVFSNLVFTTFLGLFYLTDRIHRGNTGLVNDKKHGTRINTLAE